MSFEKSKRAAALTGFLLAAACSPVIVAETPTSVTLKYVRTDTLPRATAMARQSCAKYGRDAVYQGGVGAQPSSYACVDRERLSR